MAASRAPPSPGLTLARGHVCPTVLFRAFLPRWLSANGAARCPAGLELRVICQMQPLQLLPSPGLHPELWGQRLGQLSGPEDLLLHRLCSDTGTLHPKWGTGRRPRVFDSAPSAATSILCCVALDKSLHLSGALLPTGALGTGGTLSASLFP